MAPWRLQPNSSRSGLANRASVYLCADAGGDWKIGEFEVGIDWLTCVAEQFDHSFDTVAIRCDRWLKEHGHS